MDDRERLKSLLKNALALQDGMRLSISSASGEYANVAKYSSYKIFMRKYNLLANEAAPFLNSTSMLDEFNIDLVEESSALPWPIQKERFDHVAINVDLLRSLIEGAIGFAEDEAQNLKDFVQANLRRAVFSIPEKELEIQNSIEALLIGRRMVKGIDYDRETGRVKTSGKESIPDFIFENLGLCLEVKLSKSRDNLRSIIDEINADVRCYGTKYDRQIYVVYDLSSIRDEAEFKKDIESTPGVSVVIVKH